MNVEKRVEADQSVHSFWCAWLFVALRVFASSTPLRFKESSKFNCSVFNCTVGSDQLAIVRGSIPCLSKDSSRGTVRISRSFRPCASGRNASPHSTSSTCNVF